MLVLLLALVVRASHFAVQGGGNVDRPSELEDGRVKKRWETRKLTDSNFWSCWGPNVMYRSIHDDHRQALILRATNSDYRYRIVLRGESISTTETDLWKCWQKSLITDADSPLNVN